ncbi:MAG: molybdopterin biosynthesis protein [Acidobacteriota bacterium]|nr:molybdopterin biosynthesis protein [Acidobacteriota bacterium]
MRQEQFLEVLDRDEAEARWHAVISRAPLGAEEVDLPKALGRVLADDVRATVDVPGFDRSSMDGFAVRAADTFGAGEETPRLLRLTGESLAPGAVPRVEVHGGEATPIATGAMVPRGADAVVPVEVTDLVDDAVAVRAPCVPGFAVAGAGTDMGTGETVLFAGTVLTSRETGVLAAIGVDRVRAFRRPRVAVLSTGDELVAPGEPMAPGRVFDSNGQILSDAIRELGGDPVPMGILADDEAALDHCLTTALADCDAVVLSGGTSKGEGDLCYRAVGRLDPGVVVHGVALKPGKPVCLAAAGHRPVVVLPGFPTSAIFTFHEFVAPVLRCLGGRPAANDLRVEARLAVAVRAERGRLEYLLVGLVQSGAGTLSAFPMGKGSGSVTTFSRADGFVRIERNVERVSRDEQVEVTLLGAGLQPPDLVIVGSHCVGLDRIAATLARDGVRVKVLAMGSRSGLSAALRGECDIAPVHLYDPKSAAYNTPFLSAGLRLQKGYRRVQGVVTRIGEVRAVEEMIDDPEVRMVSRNAGSGTRVLIDELLAGRRPPGHAYEPRSHHAVAAAVAQGRADWGVAIEPVARAAGLAFCPLRDEDYDFVVPGERWNKAGVRKFRALLEPGGEVAGELAALGFALATRASTQ